MKRLKPKPVYVERSMILGPEGTVLFVRRALQDPQDGGLWELPGGKLEKGESQETGRRREIFEETGLVTEVIFPEVSHMDHNIRRHHTGELRSYLARTTVAWQVGGELTPKEDEVADTIFMVPQAAIERLPLTEYTERSLHALGHVVTELCRSL